MIRFDMHRGRLRFFDTIYGDDMVEVDKEKIRRFWEKVSSGHYHVRSDMLADAIIAHDQDMFAHRHSITAVSG